MTHPALARAEAFCARLGLRIPILLAPMAGACPSSLSALANAGGLGAGGHRGCFGAAQAEAGTVGLFALLPAAADAVRAPAMAAAGIPDPAGEVARGLRERGRALLAGQPASLNDGKAQRPSTNPS